MESLRDLAIVLRSIAYQERHRIVTALSQEHGLITGFAKNAIQSRRFGGTLDIFAASEWLFTLRPGAELYHLSEAQIREPFIGLREDFKKLALGSALNEFMLKIAPQNENCEELFRLHSNALSVLNKKEPGSFEDSLLLAYMAKLLQWSGSQPRLHSCLQCGTSLDSLDSSMEVSCIISDAGWICEACRMTTTRHIQGQSYEGRTLQNSFLRLNKETILNFQLSLTIPIKQASQQIQFSKDEGKTLFQFLEGLLVYHVPGFDKQPMKSLRFI